VAIFDRSFIRGYGKLETVMGVEASYATPSRSTNTTITILYNEMVGALDGFQNALFHVRSTVTIERGGKLTYAGNSWDVVDVRDSEDGTAEIRCIRPDTTA